MTHQSLTSVRCDTARLFSVAVYKTVTPCSSDTHFQGFERGWLYGHVWIKWRVMLPAACLCSCDMAELCTYASKTLNGVLLGFDVSIAAATTEVGGFVCDVQHGQAGCVGSCCPLGPTLLDRLSTDLSGSGDPVLLGACC